MANLQLVNSPFSQQVADALDAATDGRGVGRKELQALRLCDAAPKLLAACQRVEAEEKRLRALAKQPNIHPEFLQAWDAISDLAASCRVAIAAAERGL